MLKLFHMLYFYSPPSSGAVLVTLFMFTFSRIQVQVQVIKRVAITMALLQCDFAAPTAKYCRQWKNKAVEFVEIRDCNNSIEAHIWKCKIHVLGKEGHGKHDLANQTSILTEADLILERIGIFYEKESRMSMKICPSHRATLGVKLWRWSSKMSVPIPWATS